jgi:hypothetical protein
MTEHAAAAASVPWHRDPSAVTEPGVPFFMNVTLTIRPARREAFLASRRSSSRS